jgi:hypothetical protein
MQEVQLQPVQLLQLQLQLQLSQLAQSQPVHALQLWQLLQLSQLQELHCLIAYTCGPEDRVVLKTPWRELWALTA